MPRQSRLFSLAGTEDEDKTVDPLAPRHENQTLFVSTTAVDRVGSEYFIEEMSLTNCGVE